MPNNSNYKHFFNFNLGSFDSFFPTLRMSRVVIKIISYKQLKLLSAVCETYIKRQKLLFHLLLKLFTEYKKIKFA